MSLSNSKSSKVYSGRIVDVFHRHVAVGDNKFTEFEIVHRPLVSIVIPVMASGELVITHQYRAPIDALVWEFPGGTVEKEETPLQAAKRELTEETGYHADVVEYVNTFFTSPHFSDETVHLFIAQGLTSDKPDPQEKEFITTHVISEAEFIRKLTNAEIVDAKTIVAFCFFTQYKLAT